jgi:hypothetical protein
MSCTMKKHRVNFKYVAQKYIALCIVNISPVVVLSSWSWQEQFIELFSSCQLCGKLDRKSTLIGAEKFSVFWDVGP